jgi:hypothetical protein
LQSVDKLPVDASGKGTIQGAPTGEAFSGDSEGSFVLALRPAPGGLADGTTVHVVFGHTTRVFRDGLAQGDPLEAMNSEDGGMDADPSAAGTAVVRFHIDDGRVIADSVELSDESPPGIED